MPAVEHTSRTGTPAAAEPVKPAAPEPPAPPLTRVWWVALAVILLWGVISQGLILNEAWQSNPFAMVPLVDAETYWDWAGDIAHGRLIDRTPFMSAPLYPYLIGGLRALGGSLLSVYVLQAALHVATLALLAYGAAKRFGAAAGLLAGVLFVLLIEPAFFSGRVLNCTLQLFLVVLLWLSLLRAQGRPSPANWALAGILVGLNCLANPPMVAAIPLLGLWAWWQGGWTRRGVAGAVLLAVVAFLTISPATIHNYKVSGEFIPISAQAGVTFAQGNSPNATGTYTPVTGITPHRKMQNRDALRLYQQTTGTAGTWNDVNRFFFRKGLDYCLFNSVDAARLWLRKLYLFIAGRNSADIYMPTVEIDEGLARWLRATPLPVAWLTIPALVALVALARRPRRYGPELVLFLVPLLVVVGFFFTPRYRLPAVPIIVVVCAWALVRAAQWRAHWPWSIAVAAAVVAGVGLGPLNHVYGFDTVDRFRVESCQRLGNVLARTGQVEKAVVQFQKALALKPNYGPVIGDLATAMWDLGRFDESVALWRDAVRVEPDSAFARDQLGKALLNRNQVDEALEQFQVAVRLKPEDAERQCLLAQALLRHGDDAEAVRHYQAALTVDPEYTEAHAMLGHVLHMHGDLDGATQHLRAAAALNPTLVDVQLELAPLLWDRGDVGGAIATARKALELAPSNPVASNNVAWYLATAPGLSKAEREQALSLAHRPPANAGTQAPVMLDTRAAALAANGQFAEAVQTLEEGIALAEQVGHPEMLAALKAHLELYKAGKPYVEQLGSGKP